LKKTAFLEKQEQCKFGRIGNTTETYLETCNKRTKSEPVRFPYLALLASEAERLFSVFDLMMDSTFSYSDFIPAKKRKNKNIKAPLSSFQSLVQLRDQIRQEEWFTQCSR
jgi:hypothetical protein